MYCSGSKGNNTGSQTQGDSSPSSEVYTAEEALENIRAKQKEKKNVKVFTDDDYQELDLSLREYNLKRQQNSVKKKRGRPRKNFDVKTKISKR